MHRGCPNSSNARASRASSHLVPGLRGCKGRLFARRCDGGDRSVRAPPRLPLVRLGGRVLAVPKSALLGAVYHEHPCEGTFLHLEREGRIDMVLGQESDDRGRGSRRGRRRGKGRGADDEDDEVDSIASEDTENGQCYDFAATPDPTRIRQIRTAGLLKQVDQQLVEPWLGKEQGGADIAEKCFYTHSEAEMSDMFWLHGLAEDPARGLPVVKDWVKNGGNFEGNDQVEAYSKQRLEELKTGQTGFTVLQSLRARVNRGPRCQHHGYQGHTRIIEEPSSKSVLVNNMIFDFRTTRLTVRPIEDAEAVLSNAQKELRPGKRLTRQLM